MAAILQMTYLNAFAWQKKTAAENWCIWIEISLKLIPESGIAMKSVQCDESGSGKMLNRQQAINWTNADRVTCMP